MNNMKHLMITLLAGLFLVPVSLVAQNGETAGILTVGAKTTAPDGEKDDVTAPVEGTVYATVDVQPTLKGDKDFPHWVAENLKYPKEAKENYISGRVMVRFVVTDKGKVRQIKVLRGVDESLDKEAVRIIAASSGKWNPGTLQGKPVNTYLNFPVVFRL